MQSCQGKGQACDRTEMFKIAAKKYLKYRAKEKIQNKI